MKTLDVDLEYLLQKSGKEIFLKILLTELIKDKKNCRKFGPCVC